MILYLYHRFSATPSFCLRQDKLEKNKDKLKLQRVVLLTSLKHVESFRFCWHACRNLGVPSIILRTSSFCAGLGHRWRWETSAPWLGSGEEEKNRQNIVTQTLSTQSTCHLPEGLLEMSGRNLRNVWSSSKVLMVRTRRTVVFPNFYLSGRMTEKIQIFCGQFFGVKGGILYIEV